MSSSAFPIGLAMVPVTMPANQVFAGPTSGSPDAGAVRALIGPDLGGILTTKGDILTRDATGPVRKAIGADGTVQKADSTVAEGWLWDLISNVPGVLFTKSVLGVNLKTVAVTDIFTVPTGKRFLLQDTYIVCSAVTALSIGFAASVIESGAGAALGPTALAINTVGMIAAGKLYPIPPGIASSLYATCSSGNKVQFSVSGGATATTLTGDVYVTGFYI